MGSSIFIVAKWKIFLPFRIYYLSKLNNPWNFLFLLSLIQVYFQSIVVKDCLMEHSMLLVKYHSTSSTMQVFISLYLFNSLLDSTNSGG
jgi:hypothetical protein